MHSVGFINTCIKSYILMVFVINLFVLSILSFCGIVFLAVLITHFFYKNPLDTAGEETNELIRKHKNVMYLLLIFSLLFLQKTAFNCAAIALLVILTYFQPLVWAKTISDMFFSMCLSVREACDRQLKEEDDTITLQTAGKYI